MLWGPLWSIAAHGGELDIHLLGWIKDMLDELLGLSDWAVVALTGAVILVIPVGLLALYFSQRNRGNYDPAAGGP
jgi:hypothetical protein